MRLSSTRTLCLGMALVGFATIYWASGSPSSTASTPSNKIDIKREQLAIGTVWATDMLPWTLDIINQGDAEVHVESLVGSCDCMQISPTQFAIPAAGSTTAKVTLDLMPKRLDKKAADGRALAIGIQAIIRTAEGERLERHWTLRVNVRAPIIIDSSDLSHTVSLAGDWDDKNEPRVRLVGTIPLKDLTATLEPLSVPVPVERVAETEYLLQLPALDNCDLETVQKLKIRLIPTSMGSESLNSLLVPLAIRVRPVFSPVPSQVAFGICDKDQEYSVDLVLQQMAADETSNVSASCNLRECEIKELGFEENSRRYRVTLRPKQTGLVRGQLRFVTPSGYSQSVPVSYIGAMP